MNPSKLSQANKVKVFRLSYMLKNLGFMGSLVLFQRLECELLCFMAPVGGLWPKENGWARKIVF